MSINKVHHRFFLLTFIFLSSFTTPKSLYAAESSAKVLLLVSVDWEGRDLDPIDLVAMKNLRKKFPQLGILHFLNAAYYTKPLPGPAHSREDLKLRNGLITQKIKSVLKAADEWGLHIHPWKSLVEAGGVHFRRGPTLWGNYLSPEECLIECGHEVALNSYSQEELQKLIRFSVSTLQEQGFTAQRLNTFRAGAWLGSPHVLEALTAEGFLADSSAVPANLLQNELEGTPLQDWLEQLWAGVTEASAPWIIETQKGPIWEVPDNGGLADYMTAEEMVHVFRIGMKSFEQAGRTKNIFVQIGLHQETAATFLPQLVQALEKIEALAKVEEVPVNWSPLPLVHYLKHKRSN